MPDSSRERYRGGEHQVTPLELFFDLGLAASVSSAMREDTRSMRQRLHVFQAGPLALSIMVGHLWNRMPITQPYEDLGPGAGYAPAFTI